MTTYVLPFEKMHGIGNDFIMLERRHLPNGVDDKKLARFLCDRNFGVGADGIIIVDFAKSADADFAWDYYNSDGSEAEMCGNGMRCFAKYVFEKGFTDKETFTVLTKAGIIVPLIEKDGTITVNMGVPKLPKSLKEKIIIDKTEITYTYIEIGNPHCVVFLDKAKYESNDFFLKYGPQIEKHSLFPNGVNIEFANILNKNEISCKVWERGAGPTLACGTGACAVLIAANLLSLSEINAKINLPGGSLKIWWDKNSTFKNKNCVYLNGPATFVYGGMANLDPSLVCVSI